MLERREKVHLYRNKGWQRAVEKYDLLLDYRETIPIEEQVGALLVLSWHTTEDNRTFKLTVVGVYEFSLRSTLGIQTCLLRTFCSFNLFGMGSS